MHPTDECEEDCSSSKCTLRHKMYCKYGDNLYYNSINKCEFRHYNMIQIIKGKFKEENRNFRSCIF
jgi:hypothetical protein